MSELVPFPSWQEILHVSETKGGADGRSTEKQYAVYLYNREEPVLMSYSEVQRLYFHTLTQKNYVAGMKPGLNQKLGMTPGLGPEALKRLKDAEITTQTKLCRALVYHGPGALDWYTDITQVKLPMHAQNPLKVLFFFNDHYHRFGYPNQMTPSG